MLFLGYSILDNKYFINCCEFFVIISDNVGIDFNSFLRVRIKG